MKIQEDLFATHFAPLENEEQVTSLKARVTEVQAVLRTAWLVKGQVGKGTPPEHKDFSAVPRIFEENTMLGLSSGFHHSHT